MYQKGLDIAIHKRHLGKISNTLPYYQQTQESNHNDTRT